jgi:Golgi SNAP receptor complex protein 1
MSSTAGGWAQLRQQARTLESQTGILFHKYSQFSSTTLIPPTSSEEERQTESEISDLLTRRESLISQLSRLLDSELNQSALKQNNLARHREILAEHRKEFQRLKNNIKEARDKANLLGIVRTDIEQYRQANPAQVEAEYMLEERGRIDNSHNIADSVLSQAYAVNESFGLQREALANINRRIVGAASQVPGINSLIGRIGAKKRRDGIILAVFIAFCFLMLLYFR